MCLGTIIRTGLGASILAAAQLVAPVPGHAAVCMDRGELVNYLSRKFEEAPRAAGLVADRGVMEVYVSGTGTWTIVITAVSGTACIVAAGDTWEEMEIAMALGQES
jgi:hypothetical protein